MASQPPTTATPPLTSAPSSPAVDVATHCCSRRMSSYKYDKLSVFSAGMLIVQLMLGAQNVALGLLILCRNI